MDHGHLPSEKARRLKSCRLGLAACDGFNLALPPFHQVSRQLEPSMYPPERIVCLTEETTETLYLLGEQHRIVGISGYTVRPPLALRVVGV